MMMMSSVNLLLTFWMMLASLQMAAGYHMVCYHRVANNSLANYTNIPPKECTHMITGFALADSRGYLHSDVGGNDFEPYALILHLKEDNPDLKVLLSFQAWTDEFLTMVRDPEARQNFIESALFLVRWLLMDGLDLFMEPIFVKSDIYLRDVKAMTALVNELRMAIDKEIESADPGDERLLLTAAVSAERDIVDHFYDVKSLSSTMDFVSLMAFDFPPPSIEHLMLSAPLYSGDEFNVESAAKQWSNLGMPLEKIIIGLPTYGVIMAVEGMGATPGPGTPSYGYTKQISYRDICSNAQMMERTVWDEEAQVPYTSDGISSWVSYDNAESIQSKCIFLKENGYGGAMLYALHLDDYDGICKEGRTFPFLFDLSTCLPMELDTTTTTVSQETTTLIPLPETKDCGEEFVCPREFGSYSDPCSCASFYECINFEGHLRHCVEGLVFNPTIELCDFPEDVDCSTCHLSEDGKPEESGDCGKEFVCEKECGSFRDSCSCTSFYECVRFEAHLRHCPEGLAFNAELRVCDFKEDSNCFICHGV